MPTYVYKCSPCDIIEEHIRSISNRLNRVICEECGEEMPLIMRSPAFTMTESVVERLNKNYKIRQERKAKGEFVGDKGAL